jgi:hypothetical protein
MCSSYGVRAAYERPQPDPVNFGASAYLFGHVKLPVMSGFELIARLTDALAWPIAVVVGIVVLRKSIAELIARRPPNRVKAGPFEVEWDRLLAETEKEVETELPASADPKRHPAGVVDELAPAAEATPLAAVQEAYATIQRELRRVVGSTGETANLGPVSLARRGERAGLINSETTRAVEGLSVMRNLAVHGGDRQITPERAREYLALTDGVLFALRNRSAAKS